MDCKIVLLNSKILFLDCKYCRVVNNFAVGTVRGITINLSTRNIHLWDYYDHKLTFFVCLEFQQPLDRPQVNIVVLSEEHIADLLGILLFGVEIVTSRILMRLLFFEKQNVNIRKLKKLYFYIFVLFELDYTLNMKKIYYCVLLSNYKCI